MNWVDYPNFEASEFDCRCPCGDNFMEVDFMTALQQLRTLAGFPFAISSGYRCAAHNDKISNSGVSGPHTTGKAADILVSGARARTILRLADKFTGIGIKQNGGHHNRFIHLDTLEDDHTGPRPWVWSYR